MSRVLLVADEHDGHLYALKTAPLADADRSAQLDNEFALSGRLAHPQVPAVLRLGQDDRLGLAWTCMEHIPGEHLQESLATWGVEWMPSLVAQALNVSGFLHRRGIIHGDIKPDNVLVTGPSQGPRPVLRLLDLGLAHRCDEDDVPTGGTPAFMSPALLEGGQATPETDLYALGRAFDAALGGAEPRAALAEQGRAGASVATVLHRLSQPDPDLAFRSADDALSLLLADCGDLIDPADTPACGEAPIVGRESEFEALGQAVAALANDQLGTGLWVLTGDAGIGRSRTLREVGRKASVKRLDVLHLGCVEAAPPLEVVRSIGRRILGENAIPSLLRPDGSAGDRLHPHGLYRELIMALDESALGGRTVVVIDDLQNADEPTLDFLRLFGRIRRRGPMIVAAFRSSDETPRPVLLDDGSAKVLELEALSTDETGELVASLVPEGSSTEGIVSLSGGNPARATLLARTGGTASAEGLVRRFLKARIAALTDKEIDTLRDLALLTRAVPASFIQTLEIVAPETTPLVLDRLAGAGLVERDGDGRVQVVFEALAEELRADETAPEAATRHGRILNAWLQWPVEADRPAEMLVRHALGAGRVAEAMTAGRPAIGRLLDRGSLRAAEGLIELLRPHAQDDLAQELDDALAEVLVRAGRAGCAKKLIERALKECGAEASDRRARMLTHLGRVAESTGELSLALGHLRAAQMLTNRGAAPDVVPRMLERLGAVHFRLGQLDDARSAWDAGIEVCEPENRDLGVVSDLWNDLGVLDTRTNHRAQARERHLRALEIRRAAGDLDGQARSFTNLANLASKDGEYRRASKLYRESLRLKRQVGTLSAQAVTLSNIAQLDSARGEYGEAMARLEESLVLRVRTGDRIGEAETRLRLGLLRLEKGDLTTARRELTKTRALLVETGALGAHEATILAAEAELALDLGRVTQAEALAQHGLDLERDASPARGRLRQLRGRARMARHATSSGLADLESAAADLAGGGDELAGAWTHVHLARAAMTSGLFSRAQECVDQAITRATVLGARRLLAEGLVTRSRLEQRLGDLDESAETLTRAAELAEELLVPGTLFRVWAQKGTQAASSGMVIRAAMWWRKCVEQMGETLERLDDADATSRYLDLPERLEVVTSLERLVEEGSDSTVLF